jgi:hypothetical protein
LYQDEYGIKVLHAPAAPFVEYVILCASSIFQVPKYNFSIVFVHGLTGRQLSTWTAVGATAPWPSLLLSEEIPEARISAFGYDADIMKILGQAGQNTIRQHAKSLLAGLSDMRFETDIVSSSSSQ